jgi:hypothetical protein
MGGSLPPISVSRVTTHPSRRWVVAEIADANLALEPVILHIGGASIPMTIEARGWIGPNLAVWLAPTEAAPDAYEQVQEIVERMPRVRAIITGARPKRSSPMRDR